MSNYQKKITILKALDKDFIPKVQTQNKTLVELKNIHLGFKNKYYQERTLRDKFVTIANNPSALFAKNDDMSYVLRGVNFSLFQGERVGILGVNGSGKTSLCRIISKSLFPQSGEVSVSGEVKSIYSTSIGINSYLTGRENVKLLVEMFYHQLSKTEKQEIIKQACEFSELKEALDRPYMYYSRGMQTRIFLSVIASLQHDILILDEVFDGADEFFRKKIQQRIKDIVFASKGFIFVSHSIDQILELCNRCLILSKGEIIFDGTVQDAYKIYENSST